MTVTGGTGFRGRSGLRFTATQGRQTRRKIHTDMKKINDNHSIRAKDEDHIMLSDAAKAQVLLQLRVYQTPTVA